MPTLPKIYQERTKRRRHVQTNTRHLHGTGAWKNDSESYRKENPVCEICREVDGKFTDVSPGGRKGVTDHIISTTVGGSQRDRSNFMSMCNLHHNMKRGWESRATGPLIAATTNEDNELVPENRVDIYEKYRLWH